MNGVDFKQICFYNQIILLERVNNVKKNTAFQNIITILMGALLFGLLWRVRGEHGWGSSWGLLNAGFVFTLFIIVIKGTRQKLDLKHIALIAISFMFTTPGWGTLLNQITGVIYQPEDLSLGLETTYTSVGSAVFLMLCLGFGLASLFGIMLGKGFSAKEWKLRHFIVLLAVFYITDLIASAFISPFILNAVQPEAAEVFEKGLALSEIDGSAYEVYLAHFKDVSWAKKIEGGRNYFQSAEAITSAIKALTSILATRFIIKDKIAAKTGGVVCCAFAFGITLADLFFYFGNGGYHMLNESYLPEFFYAWGCWEYFTGFIAGALITAFIVFLKPEEDVGEIVFPKIPEKVKKVLIFVAGIIFLTGVNIVRPVMVRFEDSKAMIPAIIIAVLFAVGIVALLVKFFGFNAEKGDFKKFALILLFFFVAYINIVYLVVGTPDCIHLFGNFGFQHSMAIMSAGVILIWLAFSKSGKVRLK